MANMKMRRFFLFLTFILLLLTCTAVLAADRHALFQTSTLQALMNGVYDGDFTFGELQRHGDFGLGTFDALDGELVALDGKFYQVKTDGKVYPVALTRKTPFAEVTFFKTEQTLELSEMSDLKQLEQHLSARLPSPNFPYAIRITGKFSYVKTRSVPRQTRPYPPLLEAAKHQTVFEFRDVDGVIVGFYHPQYLAGVNVTGYHFHFLTSDRRAGGHLLDCRLRQVRVELSRMDEVQLRLPGTEAFYRTDLSGDKKPEIDKVEK
jgi:acetolactate decarboxylase